VVRTQVIEVRCVHPHERRQADDEVERQDERGNREEVPALARARGCLWAMRLHNHDPIR
jgi:hypothetical protein